MRTLNDTGDVKGKHVLVRVDFNVPIQNGVVTDTYRIEAAFPTMQWLHERGARTVLISHIEGKGGESLAPVFEILAKKFPIHFAHDCINDEAHRAAHQLQNGEFLLLENLRAHRGEKDNDPDFARSLASLGEIYINEAFPAAHRAHASIVGVPQHIPGYAGLRFEKEVAALSGAFNPPRPFMFILGGAKFDTKLPLIQKFLATADTVFIGGALANDCFKAKRWPVGASVVSEGKYSLGPIVHNKKTILPVDVIVERNGARVEISPEHVQAGDKIWDAGPKTLATLEHILQDTKYVLWNGPLGNYEIGYTKGTEQLAKVIAAMAKKTGLQSIVGGGDTVASIRALGFEKTFTFLSTGGGAMLDFLVNETLPGITALDESAQHFS